MSTVKDILNYIESLAPVFMKESWDRVGLNCGRLDQQVSTILVALDPFAVPCQEAKQAGAELIVTHHALLWNPGFVTDADQQGRNALFLMENHIACINAHTNLDCAPGGVNDVLADILGLQDIHVVCPQGTDCQGRPWGLLRAGTVEVQSLPEFMSFVKKVLRCPGLRYTDGGRPVHRVAVGGGACAGELHQAAADGCDTFVTSDVRYNQFWDAHDMGISLIDAGHFFTENPVCAMLARKISEAFPEIHVILSKNHTDCAKFF